MKFKEIKYFICLVSIFIITGCFTEKMNKNIYTIKEIFLGFHFQEENGIYSKTDMSGTVYKFYFDKDLSKKNYFSLTIGSDKIKYFYENKILESSDCETSRELLESNKECSSNNIVLFKRTIAAFDFLIQDMKIKEPELEVTFSQLNDAKINIENR